MDVRLLHSATRQKNAVALLELRLDPLELGPLPTLYVVALNVHDKYGRPLGRRSRGQQVEVFVDSPGPQQRRIEGLWAVGRSEDEDTSRCARDAVQFVQKGGQQPRVEATAAPTAPVESPPGS